MSGKLHHAWLLQGEPGIGKRLLAEAFAIKLLGDTPQHQRLFEQQAHPDCKIIDRQQATKTGVLSVDTIRQVTPFLRETRALSPYRVLIIDALDNLNRNAANAALKLVEEPQPNTVMLLINHAKGRILPTLKSRCYNVYINKPDISANIFQALLSHYYVKDSGNLQELSENRIAIALELARQEEKHLTAFETLQSRNTPLAQLQDAAAVLKENLFLQKMATARLIEQFQSNIRKQALEKNPEKLMVIYEEAQQRFYDVDRLNLDWAQVFTHNVLVLREVSHLAQ